MKKGFMKKLVSVAMTTFITTSLFVGCGNSNNKAEEGETAKASGTIMWLSNVSSGAQYEATLAYGESISEELGYKLKVIYGDAYNDPAGNLTAVKNAMTKDVVGLILSQDGGVQNILEEYPELYVAGFNTDMASVYEEGGASSAAASNTKFLGTITDGYVSGVDTGRSYFEIVLEKGYKKVSIINFPAFAYPQLTVAAQTFRDEVEKYNKTASESDKIEIVGDTKTLQFAPLDNSYFLETQNQNLDAIVGLCSGTAFIYPALKAAVDAGTINKNTKLLTAGYNDDEAILADSGGDGIIQSLRISPCEDIIFPIALLDNAINGKQYSDYTKSERIDSLQYLINSKEDVENVKTKSLIGTLNVENAQISFEDFKKVLTRYNEKATYLDLKELLHSDQLKVEALTKK